MLAPKLKPRAATWAALKRDRQVQLKSALSTLGTAGIGDFQLPTACRASVCGENNLVEVPARLLLERKDTLVHAKHAREQGVGKCHHEELGWRSLRVTAVFNNKSGDRVVRVAAMPKQPDRVVGTVVFTYDGETLSLPKGAPWKHH
jgi:hypothetical protein